MGTNTYNFSLTLEIGSVYQKEPPECSIMLDDQTIFCGHILKSTTIDHQTMLTQSVHCLKIVYNNKSEHDRTQAIQIRSIDFNGVQDKKFIWLGQYQPTYPEPWATEQQQQSVALPPILTNTDYLGWAGTWTLEFTAPIFTWIHQVKNLGTIYD